MRSEQRDSYRTGMTAVVTDVRAIDGATWLSLSDSVFYPTSGGQPHDTGVLLHGSARTRVVDVLSDGPEAVLHRVEGPVPAEGATVEGEIDWERRYRHMQRHSAQHLLSQAFLHVDPSFETRSVALTSADATLDLAGEPDDAAVEAAFSLARAWAYRSLPIEAFEIDEADADAYPLRRPPKVSGTIRLVRMGDVELSACGGTHLRTTAETLPLLALARQRIRAGLTRIVFRAGLEASERASRTVALADELARSFSARWDELPERVDALRAELRAAEGRASQALTAWAEARVAAAVLRASHAERAERDGGAAQAGTLRIVVEDAAALPVLAEAATRLQPEYVVLLAARDDDRATLLFQAGPDAGDVDLRPLLRAALEQVDGRGGGKPDRVQGAGSRPSGVDGALDTAEAMLAAGGSGSGT